MTHRNAQAGISLTEAILGVAIMGVGLGTVATLQVDNIERINQQILVKQLTSIRVAAERYVRDNYSALTDDATGVVGNANDTARLADTLLRGTYLPESMFRQVSGVSRFALTPYNGEYNINLRNLGPGGPGQPDRVEMVVSISGGQAIPDEDLPSIAAEIGPSGGFRTKDTVNLGIDPVTGATKEYDNAEINGAFAGWQIAAADVDTPPAPGSVVSFAYFGDGAVVSDFLYRNDIGQPEAQRMNTNIDMNNRGITQLTQIGGLDPNAPGTAPAAPTNANTVRFGGVTAGTNGFARGDFSIEANNINAQNLAAQGNMTVVDANNVERGRISAATQALTLGAAPGGATTVVADGTGQTVTVRDGVNNRAQLTGTGQIRAFDAAGTEMFNANAVGQTVRIGSAANARTQIQGNGTMLAFNAAGTETFNANAETQRFRLGMNGGSHIDMSGSGTIATFDGTEQVFSTSATGRTISLTNGAGTQTFEVNGAAQNMRVGPAGSARTEIGGNGVVTGYLNAGTVGASLNATNGTLSLGTANGDKILANASNQTFIVRNAGNTNIITADAGAQTFGVNNAGGNNIVVANANNQEVIVRDGTRNRSRIDGNGIFSGFDAGGVLRTSVSGMDGTIRAYHSGGTQTAVIDGQTSKLSMFDNGGTQHISIDGQNGRIGANYIVPTLVSTAGAACPEAGALARDASGSLLNCDNGVWNFPKPIQPTLQTVTDTDGYASCPVGTVRVGCSGSREVDAQDTCTEEDCGYVGTVPVGTDGCKTGIDSDNGTEPTVTAYCLSFDNGGGATNAGGTGTVSAGAGEGGSSPDIWIGMSDPQRTVTCPDGYAVAGLEYEGSTWSSDDDNHGGPEIPMWLCRKM